MQKNTQQEHIQKFTQPGRIRQASSPITNPENAGLRLIFTVCSDNGKYDSPLFNILSKRWAKVKENYRAAYVNREKFKLGATVNTATASDIWVLQAVVFDSEGKLSESHLDQAIKELTALAKYEKASVHVSEQDLTDVPGLKDKLEKILVPDGVSLYLYNK